MHARSDDINLGVVDINQGAGDINQYVGDINQGVVDIIQGAVDINESVDVTEVSTRRCRGIGRCCSRVF